MDSMRKGSAFDADDPRLEDSAGYDEPNCPDCGGPCGGRCQDEPTPVTEEYAFVTVCQACDGEGVLRFDTHPYGFGWGAVTETIPCSCRPVLPPIEYARRDLRQRMEVLMSEAEVFLLKRGGP